MLPPSDSNGGLGTRLDSWKEIAAYLSRDARTVQRWEKSEGLPVHRHVHEAQATIYAYTAELDAWREGRKKAPQRDQEVSEPAPPPDPALPRPYIKTKALAILGASLVLVLGVGLAAWRWRPRPGLLPFHERDWVLVEAFENRTGEPLLDGALRNALEMELNNSTFAYVVPRERVQDTLRLMRKPADANLDLALAREVCLRDGGIRALVVGRTEKYGNGYVFSVELMDPARNVPVATHSEAAPSSDQMWPAVRKLSNWLRESLGEAMDRIDRSNRELEKVTTPSLHALQLFSEADRANKLSEWALSAQLLREAVSEDPNFASAHTWLAWDLKNSSDPAWEQEIQRAMDLSGTVSERERYFIRASYYVLYNQLENAIPVLEALVRLYPDHYFGIENLASAYSRTGRVQQARREFALAADLRPNDYPANVQAATALMAVDVELASKYAERARMLGESQAPDPPGPIDIDIALSRVDELWWREDAAGALAELQRLLQQPKVSTWPAAVAVRYFKLGRNADARAMLDRDPRYIRDSRSQVTLALRLAFYSGKDEEARRILSAMLQANAQGLLVSGFALPASQLGVPGWEQSLSAATAVLPEVADLAKGALALQEGRNSDAVSLFHTAWSQHHDYMIYGPLITEAWSTALERSGDLSGAAESLERSSGERLALPPQWLRNEARLSGLYRRLGRTSDARKIEDRLRKLLAVADADHPILKELNAR